MLDVVVNAPFRWAVIKDARRRQRRRRRRTAAGVMALIAIAVTGWLIAGHAPTRSPATPSTAGAAPVQRLRLPGFVDDTTVLDGKLWVLSCTRNCATGPDHGGSGQLTELAVGSGRVLKRVRVADPTVLTSGHGSIWIAHFDSGEVTRVDPRTARPTAAIHLQLPKTFAATPPVRRFQPSGIDFGAGRVWVSTMFGYVAEIDSRTARLIRMIWSSSEVTSTTTAAGLTWIADELNGVGTLTSHSQRVIEHPISFGGQPVAIQTVAQGNGLVWALGSATTLADPTTDVTVVTTINPRTGRVIHEWPLGSATTMLISDGGAFVGGDNSGRLFRLTPPANIQTLRAPTIARLTAATPHAIWAITSAGRLLRIGLTRPKLWSAPLDDPGGASASRSTRQDQSWAPRITVELRFR